MKLNFERDDLFVLETVLNTELIHLRTVSLVVLEDRSVYKRDSDNILHSVERLRDRIVGSVMSRRPPHKEHSIRRFPW